MRRDAKTTPSPMPGLEKERPTMMAKVLRKGADVTE